jgi:hypothetical protein
MLNLNSLDIDLTKAKKEHFEFFACYVTKKLFGKSCIKSSIDINHPDRPKFCTGDKIQQYTWKSTNISLLQNFLLEENRIEKILIGIPKELLKINNTFEKLIDDNFGENTYSLYVNSSLKERPKFGTVGVHDFFDDINTIFNYERLAKEKYYSSYKLTENLGVRSCVYCNRTYAITHRKKNGGRLMNPQLDHWFPQSDFPLLQISFYNLIPSCEVCNSRVKNDINFDLKEHYHPYQETEEHIQFKYRPVFGNKIRIYFSKDSGKAVKKTCEEMFIDEMYEAHRAELDDLITIRDKYSKSYLDILKKTFPTANLSDEQVYRLIFGVEFDKKDFHKRPFSKFKYDILQDLGIIKK